jgi:hypothetical protein
MAAIPLAEWLARIGGRCAGSPVVNWNSECIARSSVGGVNRRGGQPPPNSLKARDPHLPLAHSEGAEALQITLIELWVQDPCLLPLAEAFILDRMVCTER